MSSPFNFLMLGAMYENGGNTTHRLLDSHRELFVYPFESQPGTKYVNDPLTGLYPHKYRWPIFPNSFSAEEMYRAIIDEECKVRARTPFVSKFRDAEFDFSDDERRKIFVDLLGGKELSRPAVMESFFRATFMAWKNFKKTGSEACYVGYSPIISVDGGAIIKDFNGAGYVLHVVRNPFSAYADTKKRPVPLSIANYMLGWITCQYLAHLHAEKYPKNFFIVRYEDVIRDAPATLGTVIQKMGLGADENAFKEPSWNRSPLPQVYPWGTIKTPTEEVNLQTARELSKEELAEIYRRTKMWVTALGYEEMYQTLA